jgi:energy-coupling factor transporter ATP-binding protein EcfA2
MHERTRNSLLGYGLNTDLIAKIAEHNFTVAMLRSASRLKLAETFTEDEITVIKARIQRAPIPDTIIGEVVRKSRGCCAYCDDGNATRPYQIHHITPYSETQNNSEPNLLLVCPTHHAVLHENGVPTDQQRSVRWAWYSTVELAAVYQSRGFVLPFGAFAPIDFSLCAVPAELIEFAPVSPGTALICYPEDLAAISLKTLENAGFLLVMGRSGSGKSTYALALGGLLSNAGYAIFRYRFGKLRSDPVREISSFVSNCVKRAVIIIDDANAWATAIDIQNLAKLISNTPNVRLIATWTGDDSDDDSKLSASDLPKQALTWLDLKATVTDVLLKHEAEIINALQKYEASHGPFALGVGHMDIGLQERIWALGDTPRTVYEFIFGLRGDQIAVTDEFRLAFDDDRADLPILVAATEQIAGFEQLVTKEDVLQACRRVSPPPGVPAPTLEWVASVLERQVSKRRLIRVRDHFTTIHRKWAAKFIAAGLSSPVAKDTTEDLIRPYFQPWGDDPERVLRIWSWLGSMDGARPFVRRWESSMSETDWRFLLESCAKKGLEAVGGLAKQRFRAPEGVTWPSVVENAFRENSVAIRKLIYWASPEDAYWLREVARSLQRSCPELWVDILRAWDRRGAAQFLMSCRAYEFDYAWSALGNADKYCSGWLTEVGEHVFWSDFEKVLNSADPGDVRNVCEVFAALPNLKGTIKRSQIRGLAKAIGATLRTANLESLRPPLFDINIVILGTIFPVDAQAAFANLDAEKIGGQLSRSLPRAWRRLGFFAWSIDPCESDLSRRIIQKTDLTQLEQQIQKYGLSNRYELRVLLNFLARGSKESRESLAPRLKDIVTRACAPKDEESGAIIQAYVRLEKNAGSALAQELALEVAENENQGNKQKFKQRYQHLIEKYREADALGLDYDLEIYSQNANLRTSPEAVDQ